jgi:membrane-bound lytic murein transglycosylase D
VSKHVIQILISMICIFFCVCVFSAPSTEGIQLYQKNMHLSPVHKKKLADDITRYRNADNLWDVLRDEFTLPHYEDTPAVQEKIEWFMNNQDFLLRSATRAAPYLYYILQQAKKRHLPAELVLLPIVESGYNPFSMSNMGASGIWQLMPGTASGLGVKQDWWFDGRRDVIGSTRAALNYLAYLQTFFDGNWLLAIAAYNTGEGNVLSAIRRNIRDGRDTDFWSLPVAQQTRDYVPSLLALATIISHPDQYPVYFPPVRNAPYLAQVDIGMQINLKLAAKLAGISDGKLKQLNPGFTRQSMSSRGPYKLVLPIENVEQFTENLAISPIGQSNKINWRHYRVKTGDTLASVAKKFSTSPSAIQQLNHLRKTKLAHGANLLIPNTAVATSEKTNVLQTPVIEKRSKPQPINIAQPSHYALQPGDTIYMVRSKDSMESIAKRFHLHHSLLQAANGISKQQIKPGLQLIIPTHMRTQARANKPSTKNNSLMPGDTIYMVRRGDTMEKIARRFHTSAASIRLTNLIGDSELQEGLKLVVPTGKIRA